MLAMTDLDKQQWLHVVGGFDPLLKWMPESFETEAEEGSPLDYW